MTESNESIYSALAKARAEMKQPELDSVGRTGKNGAREYKYSSLAAVLAVVIPPTAALGIFVTQGLDTDDVLKTEAHLGAESVNLDKRKVCRSGSSQEQGSAETYAKRYALCTVFGLAGMEDDDGKGAGDQPRQKAAYEQAASHKPDQPAEKADPFTGYRIALTKAKKEGRIESYEDANDYIERELDKKRPTWDASDLRRACGIIAMLGVDKDQEKPDAPLAEEDIPF